MAVLREQYTEWKNHPVTQDMMAEIQTNMEKYIANMVMREEPDYDKDQFIRAYVKVGTSVLEFVPDFVEPSDVVEGLNDEAN